MICNVGAGVQRDGHAGGGSLVQGTVCQGAQEQPGQLTDVRDTLDKFFRSAKWGEKRYYMLLCYFHHSALDNI